MRYLALLIVMVLFPSLGQATEEDTCKKMDYEVVGEFLKSDNFGKQGGSGTGVISSDCKVWPYNKNYTISAFGYVPSDKQRFEEDKIIFIGLIDNRSRKVVSSHWEVVAEDASDSLGRNSLKLDTARYQLNERTRAIGLRYNSAARGASCPDNYSEDRLTLFVASGEILKPVFRAYMRSLRSLKGCMHMPSNSDIVDEAYLTISIGDKISNGYKDLVATATINSSENKKEELSLQFDGKSYRFPKSPPWWLNHY